MAIDPNHLAASVIHHHDKRRWLGLRSGDGQLSRHSSNPGDNPMRPTTPLLPLLCSLALLASGCGAHGLPTSAVAAANARPAAKALSWRDIAAMVAAAVRADADSLTTAVPAVLKAPSDAVAQRGLKNVYRSIEDRVVPELDPSIDEAMQAATFELLFQTVGQVTRPEVVTYVQGIADRLAAANHGPRFRVVVADAPVMNAFNAGGQALAIFSGLILGCKDEAELAGVMGHEMTHGLHRDAVTGLTMDFTAQAAGEVVEHAHPMPAGEKDLVEGFFHTLPADQQTDQDFVLNFLQGKVGPETLLNVGFRVNSTFTEIAIGREMEAEADRGGIRVLAGAGYDPTSIVRLLERLNLGDFGDPRYFSHPALGSRAGALKAQIATEGLKGSDLGADRLAAIQALLHPPPVAANLPAAAFVAGAGCFATVPRRRV